MIGNFFKYKNITYVVKDECKFKNPETREWVEAFLYSPIESNKIMSINYVRSKEDFFKKFKKI